MKKFGISALMALVFFSAAPAASAGGYVGPSANDYRRWQQRNDPNYWGGGYYGSGNRGYNAPITNYDTYGPYPSYDGGAVFVQKKRKPRAGDICYTPDGAMLGLDRDKRWYVISHGSANGRQYYSVDVSCDRFSAN